MVVCERHAKTDHPNCYTLGIGGFLQSGPGLLQDMLMVSMMLLPTRWDRVEESGLRKPNPVQKPSDVACEMRIERSSGHMPWLRRAAKFLPIQLIVLASMDISSKHKYATPKRRPNAVQSGDIIVLLVSVFPFVTVLVPIIVFAFVIDVLGPRPTPLPLP